MSARILPGRRFRIGDVVATPAASGVHYGTVIGFVADDSPEAVDCHADGSTGPVYLVNEGNVFGAGGSFEVLYSESELGDRRNRSGEAPVSISARFPLAWVDPEILCDRCDIRPAEYSNAWGSQVFCDECSKEMPEDE